MWEAVVLLFDTTNPVLYAIPFFFLLIGVELYVSYRDRMDIYETKDTMASLTMGLGSAFIDVFTKSVAFFIMLWLYQFRIFEDLLAFHWWAWVLLFFADDFSFYWHHRSSHSVRLLWAAHVNHHSSQRYHLATALRQSWTELFYKYFFYMWLALLGFHPIMIITQIAISLIYQFWIHTQTIGKLPFPIEFVFNTPSHHRVHHASNVEYLDRNHAGILIIWDRIFGTFKEENPQIPVVYGIVQNINTNNPLKIATHEFIGIWQDVRRAPTLSDKLRYIFNPPGWSHDGSKLTTKEMQEETADSY